MGEHVEDPVGEIKRLQHCINDLVSLLALPAIWSGNQPSQILEMLIEALLGMLSLDFVCGSAERSDHCGTYANNSSC
jgi:hypothetical protein